jgi:two-component system, NarL family, response regulator LiaR
MIDSPAESKPVRILIVDDHRLFRLGLRLACEDAGGQLQIVGEAANGQEGVDLCRKLHPDVVLMDISMPIMDGIQATQQIAAENLAGGVIIVTVLRDDDHVFEAIKAGARGYLLKDVGEAEIARTILTVSRGEALIDSHVASLVLAEFRRLSKPHPDVQFEHLTDGEMDILRLVAQGEENPAIAQKLSLSEKTVVNRLTSIYQKLHVNNRTQAALLALRQGWAPLHPSKE